MQRSRSGRAWHSTHASEHAASVAARLVTRTDPPVPLARPRTRCNACCMLCILHDAHRVCVLGVRRQMVGQKSPALLAVFKKADKKGGDLRVVWGALKEEPCSWGNAQRQYRAWRRAGRGAGGGGLILLGQADGLADGCAARSVGRRTRGAAGGSRLVSGCRVAARGQGCTAVHRPGWPAPHGTVLWYSV